MSSMRTIYSDTTQDNGWRYNLPSRTRGACPWCDGTLEEIQVEPKRWRQFTLFTRVHGCATCGWWTLMRNDKEDGFPNRRLYFDGILREFDVSSDQVPLNHLRDHLRRTYNDISLVTAAKFEELIVSVYRELFDCDVKYFRGSTYAQDGGIDLVMIQKGDTDLSAIQVKRRVSSAAESVTAVREFVGALLIEGFSRGIYITTGHYSRQAAGVAAKVNSNPKIGLTVQLVDGAGLLQMLRETHTRDVDSYPWREALRRWEDRERGAPQRDDYFPRLSW